MSDFPTPPTSIEYGGGGYQGPQFNIPPRRPTVVTVLAIIGIVWASACILMALFGLLMMPLMLARKPPFNDLGPTSHGWLVFSVVSVVVSLVLGAILLSGSIGSLRLARWGRKAMVLWAWVSIVVMIINAGIEISGANPQYAAAQARQRQQLQHLSAGPNGASLGNSLELITRVGSIFCVGVLLVYPIWILATFSTQRVKSAFDEPTAV